MDSVLMLEPPYVHFLSAAEGWLELGQAGEARAEFEKIPEKLRNEQRTLEAWWAICAAERNWDEAWRVGELRVAHFPGEAGGWIHRAYAARRAAGGGLSKAWAALRPAHDKFPEEAIIPFNLACYAAQTGDLEEAWTWLNRALQKAADRSALRSMALADEDLRPLWERIKQQ